MKFTKNVKIQTANETIIFSLKPPVATSDIAVKNVVGQPLHNGTVTAIYNSEQKNKALPPFSEGRAFRYVADCGIAPLASTFSIASANDRFC